ncbi:hypothetical protein D6D27_03931 [Aureobasidium pullulans]|nr:hypothetical protein D6D27_03931 [Aureobasidium pullulans]
MVHLNSGLSPFSTHASSRQLSVFTPTPRSSENGERTPSLCSSEDGILTPSECSSEDDDSCRPTDQRGEQINRKLEKLAAQNEELSKQIKDMKKQKKEERKVNKRAKAHMALVTEALRLATAVLTPLPEALWRDWQSWPLRLTWSLGRRLLSKQYTFRTATLCAARDL